jgi:C-terminal processing protease CtpA/Prc
MSHNRIRGRFDSAGGFVIERVAVGSWAEQVGLRVGQIITRINGAPVRHGPLHEAFVEGLLQGPIRVRVRRIHEARRDKRSTAPPEALFRRFLRNLRRAFSIGGA